MTDKSSDAETSVQPAVGTAFLQNRLVHQINLGQAPKSVLENASPEGEDCLSLRFAHPLNQHQSVLGTSDSGQSSVFF